MNTQIFLNITFNETRAAISENGSLVELYVERKSRPQLVGNVYKGKVGNIIPGMQAAFIDLGIGKSGFISVEDVQEESYFEFFLEEEDVKTKKKKTKSLIQDLLREGQDVLVQCVKEFSVGKGAKLSTNIAIPGRCLVLLGTVDMIGISRRIKNREERQRLLDLIKSAKPEGVGFIARTASQGIDQDKLKLDMNNLIGVWNGIKKRSEKAKSPALLYEEASLYMKITRDLVSDEDTKIFIDSKKAYQEISHYLDANNIKTHIELYTNSTPLFIKYGIEQEIKSIIDRKVWLKSGGYLIIEEAEALTVIDVNSGRYAGGITHHETIFDINMEAAREAAYQIRLRNLVGIIVIDFIDIKSLKKRKEIYRTFVESLKKDRARSVVLDMSSFCVVQLTRQRMRESLLTQLTDQCNHCRGRGYVKSIETISYEIIREIIGRISKRVVKKIIITANHEVISYLKEFEGNNLKKLATQHGVEFICDSKDSLQDEYEINIQ
jgi:ribonuclease G